MIAELIAEVRLLPLRRGTSAYPRSGQAVDGTLDIEFVAQRGDKAMVSAILVTHRPDLAVE